eukprot:8695770-Karenia_brevis.AAC.1
MASYDGKLTLLRNIDGRLLCSCVWPTSSRLCWCPCWTRCQGPRRNLRIRQQFPVVVEKWQT